MTSNRRSGKQRSLNLKKKCEKLGLRFRSKLDQDLHLGSEKTQPDRKRTCQKCFAAFGTAAELLLHKCKLRVTLEKMIMMKVWKGLCS